jgi:hypothetical protein
MSRLFPIRNVANTQHLFTLHVYSCVILEFYSFYLVLQTLRNDFYIYIDLDLYPNSNIYTIWHTGLRF